MNSSSGGGGGGLNLQKGCSIIMICTNDARLIASIAVKFSPLFKSDDQSHFAKPQKQQLLVQANIFPCNLRRFESKEL
ncbi:hypothetical protein T07_14184 [Trichinella nelsoni]|uniref:Uncharacterized protein n=1 Tax=Trichinella nelsoni TaxID=6336 RepID=A0A0V0RG92_9BILA|nr:hypothetical protein T07_14184 [Trichinella nelsoni]